MRLSLFVSACQYVALVVSSSHILGCHVCQHVALIYKAVSVLPLWLQHWRCRCLVLGMLWMYFGFSLSCVVVALGDLLQVARNLTNKMGSVVVPQDKIGKLIGPRGAVINKIRADTGMSGLLQKGKEKTTPVGIDFMRSQMLYGAAQLRLAAHLAFVLWHVVASHSMCMVNAIRHVSSSGSHMGLVIHDSQHVHGEWHLIACIIIWLAHGSGNT